MARKNQQFISPLQILEIHGFYQFQIESNFAYFSTGSFDMRKDLIEFDQNYLIDDKICVNNTKSINVYEMSEYSEMQTGCSFLMHTCRIVKDKNTPKFKISKEILIKTKGKYNLDSVKIKECLENNFEMNNLTFSIFNVRGFCICDCLEYYLNK
ncbi:hypothetical protein PVAND_001479 [Polypedilum vanderplanki]|uniref:Uncharacterized protein n=1 Tax=Polypedilum vanderplanki TaxID=319348 RepID=A0A9J6BN25_POLVA|nr:hypothetical protein PVAND_001479 [Polypedilum vanderplanki]